MKDPYVDSNGVLINKFNINDEDMLNQVEADVCFIKLINIDSLDLSYFDENLLKTIHKHIFEDVYTWAGEYRTVPIVKEEVILPGYSLLYTHHNNISKELNKKLAELNSISWKNYNPSEIAYVFARKLALLWKVHPFRDGNTRTMLSFAYLYAQEHSFSFDMKVFTENLSRKYNENGKQINYNVRDKFVLAALDDKDYPEVEHLANLFETAIKKEQENNKTL